MKKWNGDHSMVERKGEMLNKEVKWKRLYGGADGGESVNREVMVTIVFGGAQGGESLIEKV